VAQLGGGERDGWREAAAEIQVGEVRVRTGPHLVRGGKRMGLGAGGGGGEFLAGHRWCHLGNQNH
jgi:hypothetical protein